MKCLFYFVLQEAKLHVKSFKELFGRFLEESGPSVEWQKIKPPPEGSVSNSLPTINLFTPRSNPQSCFVLPTPKRMKFYIVTIKMKATSIGSAFLWYCLLGCTR